MIQSFKSHTNFNAQKMEICAHFNDEENSLVLDEYYWLRGNVRMHTRILDFRESTLESKGFGSSGTDHQSLEQRPEQKGKMHSRMHFLENAFEFQKHFKI